jgi:hypothetical protein
MQPALDHGRNLIITNGSRSARAGLIQQTCGAVLQKTATLLADRVSVDPEFSGHRLARDAIGAAQDDPAALR